ncbi:MAG TPA: DUF2269 family protein [Thermoanaerobaculia bacterium]|jgi:uncharacterized membrane protein|nr:DUF2269 family protein [Thermoanaerobaculia bacterium]
MTQTYQILKLIHVAAVIIFLGNIITGLFWKAHADRTKDVRFIAHTMDGIIRADRWFTIPGVIVITAAGILAAIQGGLPILRTGWILWSLIAFSASGIAFAWKVAPLQKEIVALTRTGESFDWTQYRSKSLQWELWGLFAIITPVLAVIMMVLKRPA